MSKHQLFPTWLGMMKRCYDPANAAYQAYGGRGISVCDRWRDVSNFIADNEARWVKGFTLDRIDNDGDYTLANTRWATRHAQSLNRRSNVMLTHHGRTQALFQWARELGFPPKTLWARINTGWPTHEALTTPVSQHNRRNRLGC